MWSEWQEDTLRTMWAAGKPASQIAYFLHMSRGAIVAKVHRMRLPNRATVRPPKSERINIKLGSDLHSQLVKLVNERKMTKSKYIRQLIEAELKVTREEKNKQGGNQKPNNPTF